MRNVADHTSLADIVLVRRLISLHFLVPLPADAVVTPVTFNVPRHTGEKVARGFLADLDGVETGQRELSGEWVVGTEIWQRLKRERWTRRRRRRVASPLSTPTDKKAFDTERGSRAPREPTRGITGSSVEGLPSLGQGRDSPDSMSHPITRTSELEMERQKVIYYIHGGAYYVGNAATHRLITIGVSKACNARVFGEFLSSRVQLTEAITYRLAPEHTFPLPLHDVFHGYLRLLEAPLSIAPENIIIAGDSAGGGLSLALCMYLRDEGYKLPSGLVLMSPWVDLTMSCGSWDECGEWDVVPRPEADGEPI
jgi:acetyl esterase/lipase